MDEEEVITEHEEQHLKVANVTFDRLYEVLSKHQWENDKIIEGNSRCARLAELHAVSVLAGKIAVAICTADGGDAAEEILDVVISEINHQFKPEDATVN